jgi:hypothetical protein
VIFIIHYFLLFSTIYLQHVRLNGIAKEKIVSLKVRAMNFEKISTELNNKNVMTRLKKGSLSYLKYGEVFVGKLVGRSKDSTGKLGTSIVSLTVLAGNYIAYQIPTQDIIDMTETLIKR